MTPEQKLQSLGIELPSPAAPVGAYVAAVRTGNLVFTAGQLPGPVQKSFAQAHLLQQPSRSLVRFRLGWLFPKRHRG